MNNVVAMGLDIGQVKKEDIKKEIKFNLLFWCLYFLYEWLGNAAVDDEYYRYFINACVLVPVTMLTALITVQVLLKRFYFNNQKGRFWFYFVLTCLLVVFAKRTFNYFYTYPLYFPEGRDSQPFVFLPKLIIEMVNTYLIIGFYAMFYFVKAWYSEQQVTQALMQEKTQAELDLLKAQVQPHFIFNTLNNIYSLSLNKDPRTSDLIYRLSSFLDYKLYDSNTNFTTLEKEVEFLKNYLELQKLRFEDNFDVSFNVYSKMEGYRISPLLLLPLVENCFKHSLSDDSQKSWIRIDLSTKEGMITIKLENSLPGTNDISQRILPKPHSGMGLEIVNRKLEILYQERHELICRRESNSYLVILKLNETKE